MASSGFHQAGLQSYVRARQRVEVLHGSISRWRRASSSRSWAVRLSKSTLLKPDRWPRPVRPRRDHGSPANASISCLRQLAKCRARGTSAFVFQF